MKSYQRSWTEADYAQMSWHDNHVHGLTIHSGEHGTGELILDLDYILEWLPPVQGRYSFVLAPASLCFREVSDLRISLDYMNPSAAITPFSINAIDREQHTYPNGFTTYRWSVGVNWPEGLMEFIASGFRQTIRGEPVTASEQVLTAAQRRGAEYSS